MVTFDDSGTPVSTAFDDVYFSRGQGLAESRHVFLGGNDLEARWLALQDSPGARFVIFETGFGTGLNLLAAWQLWRRSAPPAARLFFVSAEKFPLARDDLQRALRPFTELAALCEELVDCYPPPVGGLHAITLDGGRVNLLLGIGEVSDVLDAVADCDHPAQRRSPATTADAWFLDGFAPSRNPDMWSDAVLDRIAAHSDADTTFATFTAAGGVRRGLAARGFDVIKTAGFGRKRDMLRGRCVAPAAPPIQPYDCKAPWHLLRRAAPTQRKAVVVGAGLAGCHTALALHRRGWRVTLLEQAAEPATGASGNPAGLLYARLSPEPNPVSDFSLASYLFAVRHYRRLAANGLLRAGRDINLGGFVQLGCSDSVQALHRRIGERFAAFGELVRLLDPDAVALQTGVAVGVPGLWFEHGGRIDPTAVCRAIIALDGIELACDTEVSTLHRDGEEWLLAAADGRQWHAPVVVACTAFESAWFAGLVELPLATIRGQVSRLTAPAGAAPDVPICHHGYAVPLPGGDVLIGATFDRERTDTTVDPADDDTNRRQLADCVPTLARRLDAAPVVEARAGLRCTTPDYLPLAGPLPDIAAMTQAFAPLARNARCEVAAAGRWLDGLFVNTGHGARGLTSAPLCAELVAALASGEPRPLVWPLQRALSPARFALRDLVRGRLA